MQVSQQDDHITHAVIGNQESISMGVSDDAALMHILSSTLYTYPQLAVVREIICNAWDAHIAAGKTDTPIQIILTEDSLTVRDFGFGISHANIGPIYGVYGNSTKRDDSASTGGFGLGSKAPFAYTDNFEVTSHHLGQKTVYRVSKSSMEKGGKPSINKIVSLPTLETGIAVSFGIQKSHKEQFLQLIKEVLLLGEIQAQINDEPEAPTLPMSTSKTGYLITDYWGTLTARINLRYGNVVYPVPEHPQYAEVMARIHNVLGQAWNHTNIIFQAPADSISIAPSREALILTDATVNTIAGLLSTFDFTAPAKAQVTVIQDIRHKAKQALAEVPNEQLIEGILSQKGIYVGEESSDGVRIYDNLRKALRAYQAEKMGGPGEGALRKMRFQELARRKAYLVPLIKDAIRQNLELPLRRTRAAMRSLVAKHLQYPLMAAVAAYPELEKCRRGVYLNQGYHYGKILRNYVEAFNAGGSVAYFLKRKALIARSAKEAEEFLDARSRLQYAGILCWYVGRNKNSDSNAELIKQVLTRLGYEVSVHLPEKVKKEVEPKEKSALTQRKKNTYLPLTASYCPSIRNYLLSRARKNFTEDTLIESPIAFTVLHSKYEGAYRIGRLSKEASRIAFEKWGNQVAVVTSVQADKLVKQGVPSLDKYLSQYVDDTLSASADFKRYLAFGIHGRDSYSSKLHLMRIMSFHPELMDSLNLRFSIKPEIAAVIELAHGISTNFTYLPKCYALACKIKKHQKFDEVLYKLDHTPWENYISFSSLVITLQHQTPGSQECQLVYEIIRNILK